MFGIKQVALVLLKIIFDGGKSATCIGVITAIRAARNATPSLPRGAGGLARTISASGSRAASSSASAIISRAYAARWWRRWRRRAQRRIALIAAVIAAGCPALGLSGITCTPSRIILVAAVRAAIISTLCCFRSAVTCASKGRIIRTAPCAARYAIVRILAVIEASCKT